MLVQAHAPQQCLQGEEGWGGGKKEKNSPEALRLFSRVPALRVGSESNHHGQVIPKAKSPKWLCVFPQHQTCCTTLHKQQSHANSHLSTLAGICPKVTFLPPQSSGIV